MKRIGFSVLVILLVMCVGLLANADTKSHGYVVAQQYMKKADKKAVASKKPAKSKAVAKKAPAKSKAQAKNKKPPGKMVAKAKPAGKQKRQPASKKK